MPGGERIDARLVVHDVNLRNRNAGCDRHFFDDVEQLALVRVDRVRIDEAAIEQLRDRAPAASERQRLEKTAHRDHGERAESGADEDLELRPGE
jgi:hypothetical protein